MFKSTKENTRKGEENKMEGRDYYKPDDYRNFRDFIEQMLKALKNKN